jgi:uncharacterized protein (DUF1697 family)
MGDQTMAATQYIAFLRAVNVGGRIVKMTELKKIFEAAGLDDVATFIASGNVIFRSSKAAANLEPHIERALEKGLGYTVTTIVRTVSDVARVSTHEAYSAKEVGSATLYVGFAQDRPSPAAVNKLLAMQTKVDELRIDGREIYWLARKNIAESTISMAAIEKAAETRLTFRNLNTVKRLAAKYPC